MYWVEVGVCYLTLAHYMISRLLLRMPSLPLSPSLFLPSVSPSFSGARRNHPQLPHGWGWTLLCGVLRGLCTVDKAAGKRN